MLLITSQLLDLPFNYQLGEQFRLIEMAIPVFVGCLPLAINFIFHKVQSVVLSDDDQRLLYVLVNLPFFIFFIATIVLFVTFYVSNLPNEYGIAKRYAMSFDQLYRWSSVLLSFFTVITNGLSMYLFSFNTQKK
jgi:hypothetical protein